MTTFQDIRGQMRSLQNRAQRPSVLILGELATLRLLTELQQFERIFGLDMGGSLPRYVGMMFGMEVYTTEHIDPNAMYVLGKPEELKHRCL